VSVGLVGHTALATLGLGALLRTSEGLFTALKLIGAAYLLYLGLAMIFAKHDALAPAPRRGAARCGCSSTARCRTSSNPKIAIFYFAFLPQFVAPGATHPTLTIFALGLAFAALTFVVKAPIGVSAGALSAWLRARPGVLRWLFRSSGAVLVGLSVRLALERRD
jgi:threonine/homoserine/homoserine lactone efflux protein